MHLPVTGTIYLHHDDVFALGIRPNLLRFVPPVMGQTIKLPIFLVLPKPDDQANLSYPEKHNKFLPVLSVLCFCLFVCVCFLVCGAPKMKSSILFILYELI